jgi:hypothetical protein
LSDWGYFEKHRRWLELQGGIVENPLRFGLLTLAVVVVFATGFLLARAGRPYGTGLLTVHKLVDLAAVVFLAILIVSALRASPATTLEWVLVIAASITVLATFATGGVVSATDSAPSWVLVAHRALPWPLVLILGATAYRILSR